MLVDTHKSNFKKGVVEMFINLRSALKQKRISIKQYAEFLGVSEKTVQNKINGNTDFTYPEFKKTCTLLFPEYNPDYLFATEDDLPKRSA